MKNTTLLAIESSCDDTSAAVLENGKVLSNVIASQKVHEEWGGVVPELASRAHTENMVPVVHKALEDAGKNIKDIGAIAFTKGPGLLGSLLVGSSFAKGLALSLQIPLIGVHHMQAHVMAHFIDDPKPNFPFLCLTVSGGHTQLVWVTDYLSMEVIGETLDDAAGEAFDKTAKMLGLPYPGGPGIDKLAQQGNDSAFTFAKPDPGGLSYSFSGFKTSVQRLLAKHSQKDECFIEREKAHLAASIQKTIVDTLLRGIDRALEKYPAKGLAIAGGVSANSRLRLAIEQKAKEHNLPSFIPDFQYCLDNAGMIAIAGWYKWQAGQYASLHEETLARWAFPTKN